MKSYQFLEIYIRFDKKEKKHSYNSQLEKKNREKLDFIL